MTDAEFLFQLITVTSVIAGFLALLYGAYSKLIAPIVVKLQEVSNLMDKFTYTLQYLDKKVEPLVTDIDSLDLRVAELEKSLAILKVKLEHLKEKDNGI